MPNSYLFYDIETSGLNRCFDQVFQFAAIRTDLDLNELERHEILVKLNPDILPSPTAVLVHQLPINQLQAGICEYEAMQEIHVLFNTPGTITVGYNNLGFDDEFLRFSFYRNLLTPYTHQYANNCSRMDIYPITVMYYLYKSQAINWPKVNNVTSLKLEHLSKHNELMQHIAHEAMSDVEATLALARLLKKEQKMWEYLCGYFNKQIDLERFEKIPVTAAGFHSALLIDGNFGVARFYQSPAVSLEMHHHYKNQSLWLPLDQFSLATVTPDNLATTTFVYRKRFGEPPILLPLTEHYSQYLNDNRKRLLTGNIEWLQKNQQLFFKIAEYHQEYKYPKIPDLDVDAALYQIGFMKEWEQAQCNNFHAASLQEKINYVDHFSTSNLRTQAIRILGRNYPEELSKVGGLYAEYLNYLKKIKSGEIIFNYKNEIRLTAKAALAEIEYLKETKDLNDLQSSLLLELSKYIQSW